MERYQRVTVIHWAKPFGHLIWSQHMGLRAHGFYYNGKRTMYVFGVSFRPFRIYVGKAF